MNIIYYDVQLLSVSDIIQDFKMIKIFEIIDNYVTIICQCEIPLICNSESFVRDYLIMNNNYNYNNIIRYRSSNIDSKEKF